MQPPPPSPKSLLAELNPEQRAAVTAPDGPILVIAAAGTGKTRTLTHRVAHLVARGVDPARILLLTFTNRAAQEMLERARALVGEAVGGIWGGTFHHLANRILRRYASLIGYGYDYSILDRDDA
ncbi:MAG TPA: ATP-dependent helicase, partial [Kiritimatiellae bacterium]|nr:ATP-dependent helicase [Kiritimatiellia bacterium]